jgi:hypothetical protein
MQNIHFHKTSWNFKDSQKIAQEAHQESRNVLMRRDHLVPMARPQEMVLGRLQVPDNLSCRYSYEEQNRKLVPNTMKSTTGTAQELSET